MGNSYNEVKKIVAIYTRVSSKEQAEGGYSLDAQETETKKFCETRGYEIYKVYQDAGYSAGDDKFLTDMFEYINKRPALKRLYEDAEKGLFNHLLVWKWDRHGRDPLGDKALLHLQGKYGVTSESVTEGSDSIVRGVRGILSYEERERLKERIKSGLQERVKNGLPTTIAPFGYKPKKVIVKNRVIVQSWEIDEKKADIVRNIYKEYLEGNNYSELMRKYHLNSVNVVKNILQSKWYLGFFPFRSEWYQGKHIPIIDLNTYDKVQKQIKKRKEMTSKC